MRQNKFLTVWKSIAITTTLLVLNGCAFLNPPPREVEIKTVEVQIPIQHPVLPRPIDMKEPKWYVVSNKNLDEFLERIEKESGSMVFVAMSVPDYELMAYNLQEIKRFVKQTKEVIVYYKNVTDPDNDEKKDDSLEEKYFSDEEKQSEKTPPKQESSFLDTLKERVFVGGRKEDSAS